MTARGRHLFYRLVSIVLPVHNQADHIEVVVGAYESALAANDRPHELILVANGCGDTSVARCRTLADAYASVQVVHAEGAGWGLAVRLGLARACGDLLCFANSARTSPDDLVRLIAVAEANPNVIVKARRAVRDTWTRRIGSLIYNVECRWLLDLPNWDVNGTPKAFPRCFEPLRRLTRDDDLLDAEFSAIVSRERYPLIEVPISATRRHGGVSTTGWRSAWAMYLGACRLAHDMKRGNR